MRVPASPQSQPTTAPNPSATAFAPADTTSERNAPGLVDAATSRWSIRRIGAWRFPEEAGLWSSIGDHYIALMLLAAYSALLVSLPGHFGWSLSSLVLAAIGASYVVFGIVGFATVERSGQLWLALGYFAVQLILGGIIAHTTQGNIASVLLLVLLCGQSARVFSHWWMVAAGTLLVSLILMSALPAIHWSHKLSYGYGLLLASGFVVVFARIVVHEQRQRQALHDANQQLHRYAAQAEQLATIQERNRLAREIHDGLGHYLTAINMQVQGARAVLDQDHARADQSLAQAQTLTREALADVRHSVASLRSAPPERRPLPEALTELAAASTTAGLTVTLDLAGTPRALPPQSTIALVRVAQEGLTNVRRHAQASTAVMTLDYRDPRLVRLTIRDDGTGATSTDGGFGMVGLRERVQLLGGTLTVETTPGAGLTLLVEVPA